MCTGLSGAFLKTNCPSRMMASPNWPAGAARKEEKSRALPLTMWAGSQWMACQSSSAAKVFVEPGAGSPKELAGGEMARAERKRGSQQREGFIGKRSGTIREDVDGRRGESPGAGHPRSAKRTRPG